jgi:DNA modification methylase
MFLIYKKMQLSIIPTSVIDLEPATNVLSIRDKGEADFDKDSSRKIMSQHPSETCKLVYEFFLRDSTCVFDPFAGFGQRHWWAKKYGKKYIGFDISKNNIEFAKNKFDVDNVLADSATEQLPLFDGVYTCPPYFNLEVYEGGKGIDKEKTWDSFLASYSAIWKRIVDAAPPKTKFCVQVGDWRKKNLYYNFRYETEKMFFGFGCEMFDQVIMSRKKITKIKILLPQCKRLGYSIKLHETLLVFQKPSDSLTE